MNVRSYLIKCLDKADDADNLWYCDYYV